MKSCINQLTQRNTVAFKLFYFYCYVLQVQKLLFFCYRRYCSITLVPGKYETPHEDKNVAIDTTPTWSRNDSFKKAACLKHAVIRKANIFESLAGHA